MTRVRVTRRVQRGERVELDEGQAHHLRAVLRVRQSDPVTLLGPAGEAWHAEVVKLSPLELMVLERDTSPSADPEGHLEVWVPLLKGGKSDDLVRQLTELGASEVVCYAASRSVAKLELKKLQKRLERWASIASEATRQCGRREVPEVRFSEGLPLAGPGVYLWEGGGEGAALTLKRGVHQGALRVLIGPEGGLSDEEAELLNQRQWRAASLGPRILRAETAVLAAATLALVALTEPAYS